VRVTSSYSLYNGTFSLQLYPQYGQDPVSIEYRMDITNCRSSQANFYVSSHPPQLVIDREEAAEVISENFYSSYFNRFYTSRSNCPLLKLEILDNNLEEWTDGSISLTGLTTPAQAVFGITNNVAFTKTFKIRGYSTAQNSIMNLNFRVCGEESISLTDSAKKIFTFGEEAGTTGMSDSVRYHYLPQSNFQNYFSISPSGDPCTVEKYELTVDEVQVTTTTQQGSNLFDLNLGDLMEQATGQQITMQGSLGNYQVRVDKTMQSGVKNIHIKAITRGLIEISQAIEFRICPKTGGTHVTPG
jgi:hypothetical protein